ncbi:zinc finger protein 687a isoform X2 [Sphaeramia orbicularis]|uniref:zinc finger protein 687a isoform X2 n=1 Tax=Sphaeramia orbicularis TaxID=375764 RepID=UPI00117D5928|nr:zinc finger protein 687a-like isoform X2 [Sphaeramia orbicularis]
MGDMKTPDFDDLLAAFDIPDIDAKEALQSRPEEERNEEVGTNADVTERESPSGFTSSPAHHSNQPVSVIVKNNVLSESVEEEEEEGGGGEEGCASDNTQVNNSSSSGEDSESQVKLSDLTSGLGPNEAPVELQIVNGLEGSATRAQPQCSPLRSTQNTSEKNEKGAETGSDNNTSDVMDTLKPLLYPQSLTSGGISEPHNITSSCPPSPHSVSLHHPPLSPQNEGTCVLSNTPSSSLPQNGNLKAGIMLSDEDDSEPDLGGPLVIQESPESVMTPFPKFKRRVNLRSDLLGSPEKTTCHVSDPPHLSSSLVSKESKPQLEEEGQPSTPRSPSTATQPPSPRDCLPSVSTSTTLDQVERYPEHVIEERDSPESPPPSETGLLVSNRSTSSDLAQTAGLTRNPKDSHCKEELMESEHSQNDWSEVTEELAEKVETANGESLNEESTGAIATSEDTLSASAEINSSPLRPLKVKIKMPTGSITRTMTGVAPKKGGRTTARTAKGSKPSSDGHNTRSKRGVLQQSKSNAVTSQQDTCATTLDGASTVKGAKLKISCTAVSITKNTALPSVAASSKGSPGGINLHSLGQKTLNNGTALPPPSPLLPPQNSSRPASIVNSTGATISKTQTSLVEAFNKILNNKNLLPTYKPDLVSPLPTEWGLSLPAQGYRCLECGDAFALEQSLARHYDRRSLRIEVTCNHCAKRLAFFNKCSLLLHAREHKERGLIMQCSHLVMKPVSMEQMIGRPEPAALGQFTPNAAPQSHNRKAEELQYCSNKCPECQAQFSSTKEVAEHLQEIKTAQSSPCTDCSPPMLLSNSCFAAAHQRIHQGNPPHVCPECGGTAKQPQFKTHLDETCLHFARRIGYRCSSCLVVFGGLNSVKSHIQQAHCDMFHKCPSCPMAFKSASSIQSHITAQHPTLTEGQTMLIYKCVMCDTVFTHKSLLYSHFDNHLANQKVHVFKCPECTKLFSQRNSLLDHFKTHRTPKVKQELPSSSAVSSSSQPLVKMESSDGEEWMDKPKEKKVKTERMKTPSGWKCLPCQTHYTEREDFITHMAEQHGKILKKFPCNKCESSFTTTSSLRRHIRDKHKILTRGFRCQFCIESKKIFSSRAMLERHVQLRHHMDTISQETVMGGRDEADSSSEHDGSMVARQRRRAAVKAEQDEESTNGPSPVKKRRPSSVPAPSCLPDSGFRCAPCGFTTDDKALFLEHISQHRRSGIEGGGQQCLQCGACFTSTSSLSRHRFIIHKVRDAFADNQELLSAHPAGSPSSSRKHDDKSSQSGSAPASPSLPQGKEEEGSLTCKVCGKQFEKTTDLNTHFRTHGMAFINARNAGKTS